MTLNEAIERASAIWGESVIDVVVTHGNGLVETDSRMARRIIGATCSQFQYHAFDRNGHPTCHTDCEKWAAKL